MATDNRQKQYDNRRKLFDELSKSYEMGSFEKFGKDIWNEKKRKALYDTVSKKYEVGTFNDFSQQLGVGAAFAKPAPAKPAANTAKQILKSRPTMQIVDGESVPAKRKEQPAKSGSNPLTQASQRYWQAQAEMVKPVTPTQSYAPGELLQKPKSNRELVDAAKKQLRATKPQAQTQPWTFADSYNNAHEPSLAGAIDSATEAVKRQHTSLTAQLKHNSPLPMTKEEVAARAEDEVAHEDYVAEQNRQQDFDRGINGLLAKYKTKDAAEKAWANAEARTKASREAHNDKIWSDYAMMGGGPQARMAAAGETYTSNLADYLKEHDLQMMANDAWASLGRAKQQGLISGMADMVRKQYPKMSDGEVRKMATRLARQHSDQAVFDLAVKKNTPKSATDLFLRHAIGMSSVAMLQEGLARSKAGSTGDWAAREVAEQKYNKGLKNKAASIAGSVVGLAVDPLTIISAGVGSVGAKVATAASAKLIGKAATRKAATTLGGRIAMGAIQGAANFGTFEAGREVAEQARWGGHRSEDTGEVEGYSLGAVGKQFGHGAVMGAATGVVAPMVGNISDKLVKATASTAGKAAIRTGELGVSTLAEGTIFSVPEWASGNRDAMDVWTDNLAMMAGFKGHHLIKSVPHTIDALRKADNPTNMAERNHNRRSFEERLRMVLDGQHTDLALSKEEQDELKRGGYDDLNILVTDHARYVDKQKPDGKSREVDPSRTIESKTHNDDVSYDIPYNRFEQLMSDGQISEAARAKMYYYLTGHIVPMSTVIGGSTFESVGQDGKTNYTVQSIGANGVVTSRTFANKRQADLEETRIMRQAELNGIDIGEQHYNNLADSKRFSRACNIVADEIGAPVNMIKELMHRDPKTITPTEQDVVKRVTEHYDSLADDFSLDTVRKDVETDTGVDIDKAISKDASKRSSDEQRAVKTYISRLYDGVEMPKWEFVNDPSYNTRRIDITDDDTPYDDEVADEEKGEMPVDHSVDKAYTDGYNVYNAYTDGYKATDIADYKDVKMRYDELRGELSFATDGDFLSLDYAPPTAAKEAVMSRNDWSENQKEKALAYINARQAWDGVMMRISDDIESMEAQQHEELKQKQHTDGELHPATLKETDEKGHGKEVFIVDGHVQMTEDGSMVDHANSDKTVVVFDPATGERKMIDPTSDTGLSAVGEVLNIRTERQKISNNLLQYKNELYREIDGKVRVELGQNIVLPTGEDAVVVATSADNEDITVMLEDGSQKNVSRAELQQMADEQAIADYRQRNGIKDEPPASSEVSEPAEVTQGESVVEGAPSDFTPDMELTIRDEDGTEKPALVMGRVRYEDGSFVPDDNGSIVEYYADGEVMHEHESKLADKVVSHVSSEQEDVQAVDTPATEAEAPKDDNTSDSDVAAEEEDAAENVPATHAEVAEEATGEAEQEQTALSRIPKDEKGNPILEETDPETAWDGTVEYMDNAEDAREYVDGMVAQLTKEVDAAKKRVGKVKNTGSMEQFKADKAAAREEQAAAERRLAHWQQIAGVDEARKEAERQRAAEVRAEEERIAHDKAVAQAQADFEARKAAEAERKAVGNENPMPAITEKWNTATKIDGHKDEIMLPNGEPLKGHYVLHESGASSPSHNSENWAKTDGFPMDANDNSVNDRDYERDRDAQRHTEGIAQQYDQRALQNVPVVSNDGVVLSGNGRTIAGEIAARNNTDGAYVDYLKEYAHKFGFTPEQVEGMHHPRVSFVPDDAMPYTAETFARFNQQEMKSQNKTEQAVKLGKTVSDDSFGRIVRTINGYDTLGDFYNDPQASLGAVNDLHGAGVIPQAQMAEMVDGGRGNQRLSAVGREFLENMLIGKAFDGNPDVVRMLTEIPSMRQSVITALGEISDNIALGDGWALQNELADAVKLVYDARNDGDYQHGDIVSVYARQGRLFADPDELQTVADFNNMTMLMLADVLNDKRVTMLKTTLALYNKDARDSANGVQDIFAGGVVSREEILRNVIKFINNAQRKELEAAHAAAVERRKTEGVQQDGTPPQVDEAERRVADDGGDTAAERGQSKSNTLSQENTEPRQIKLSDPRTMSDEEKQRRGEMLRDAYAIEVTVGQIVATEEVSARRAAEKWWDENVSEPAFYDTEAGEVEINRNSVESSLAHRYGQMKLDAITSLIDGFENAVYLGTMPDSRERGVVDHYFAYPIMYNGERCYVFCRAMQDANKNRLYVHEVFVAERIKKGDTLQTAASKPHGGISLYRDILANVLDASKEEVRSASEEQNEQSATDNTLRAEDKSDNPTTPNGNVSNSSAGKVTESSEELQEKEDKFTPAPIEDGEDYVDYAARVAAVKAQHDAIKAAENATDTNPTDGQKKAGNYKKGHVQIGAFDISVEQPKGSVRRGKDADGKEWESKMNNTYGYFRGTEGVDGDHIDVFLSNDIDGWNGRKVFVVDQYNPDGTFDEHKVMLGFNDADDAKSNYLANYEKGWENGRRIEVSTTNLEDFEKWITSSKRKTKPFAEYKGVRIDEVQSPSEKYQPIIQATFNKVKREQGIIEPIAEKKRKPFTVFDITIKDPRRPMFGGVYHDGGMAVATNGLVMLVHKEAYDKAKEGKIITSKGDVIEGKFSDWRGAIPKETIPTGLQTEPLLEFVNGALARMKAEKAKKYEVDGALAYIKFQDGNVVCCQLVDLQKMLHAAKSIGADDLRLGTDKEFLVAESPAGKAIVIIQGEEKARYNAGYNNFAYEAPTVKGEEEVSDKVQNNEQQVSTDSEERAIIERAKEDGSYMKAPNGEPTRLTEKQWAQVRTKAFKSWFGDWENNPSEASKFVDENGEPMVFYHNTNNNFSVFDSKRNGTHTDAGWLGDGFYFYGDENEGSGYGNIKMGVFLNVRDPYYATSEENNQLAEANSRDMSVDFRENLEEEGYDGVFYNGDLRQEAVVFEPNQIKSATDNNGEFSQESDDIRYRESKGSSERTLVGIHNISADKLSKAIKQGGLANPSVAIIDISKQQHTGYGEISLIMPSDKINKRTGKNAGTFEGDAWTPMYPSVERQMSREGSLVMEHDIKALPNEMQLGVRNALRNWLDSRVDTKLSYLYLFQQGKAPDFETIKPKYNKEVHRAFGDIMHEVTNVYDLSKNDIEKLVDLYVKTELNGDINEFNQSYERNIAKHKEILSNKKPGSLRYKIASIYLRDAEEYGRPIDVLQRFVDEVWRDKNTQGKVSIEKTFDAANKKIKEDGLENDYKKWTDGLNERYQTKEVIFDGFTPSGMRRYIPNTLENVSKLMKKQGRNASNGIGASFSNFAASVMKANTSLDSIRKKKGKLTNDHQDLDDFEEKWQDVYVDLSRKLQPDANAYDDYGFARLQEAASEADPQAYLQKEYGVTLSDEDTQRLKDMVKAIKEERPSMYFETKFERPVTFDEFAAAVVPHNTDAEIKQQLRDAGLKVVEYEAGNEESRAKAVDEASKSDDIRFRQEERAARDLTEVNERFNKELQRYVSGEMDKNEILHLGNPQGVIKEFLPNLPIVMRQRIIKKGSEKRHNVDVAAIMDMPKSLSAPIFVFQRSTDTIGVLTDMKDREGKNVCVAIELNKRIQNGAVHLEVNDVRSFHGREFKNIIEPIVNNRTLMWADKEKGLAYLSSASHQVQQEIDKQVLISAANILKDFENPTIDGKNHSALSENTLSAEASHDREAMRNEAVQLSDKLHTPIKIVENVKDITHSNAEVERRKRNSKGWYDVRTGEVVVVLPNNSDVEDVAATVMHETVAHKGLRELVGEEHYDDFLDEVYEHLRGDLKQRVDAEAGRSFVDDSTKNGERAKSYEQHRRTAVDELFGDMAEKPFEEFSEGERTLWQKLKEVVRKLLDKFLASLKLPKWFELGDNELRYMLWRSKERLERGKEHPIDLARDMVMREELGLSEAARMRMGDAPDTFKARQKRAVEKKGIVMPGLNEAEVKVVRVPRHSYKGNIAEATRQAIDAAKSKYAPNGEAKTLHYNNFGATFDYSISGGAIEESLNPKQQAKSVNKGVHLAMAEHLDEIIGQSIEVEEHPDYLKNERGERDTQKVNGAALMHRFYGAVVVDGVPYRVMTLMREEANSNIGNGIHAYEVQKIEVLDNMPNTSNGVDSHSQSKIGSSYPLAKLLKDVEKSYDSGKKVLDESRKADEDPILYRDGGETEDIWKDKSMGLYERTTAAAMRLADKHQENKTLRNDAMRAIGNNLADLRKAMSLQRKFDMATVKRVSDLARVLMNNGYIGDMTQQEVKSLLAAVRNSVGHNDIDRDVQKVMEIMVKNQLRRAEKALSALEAIKGSKVNAKGVKVQGKLDAAGAQLMEVFKNIIEPIVNNHTLM